jgi:hypothetical protein
VGSRTRRWTLVLVVMFALLACIAIASCSSAPGASTQGGAKKGPFDGTLVHGAGFVDIFDRGDGSSTMTVAEARSLAAPSIKVPPVSATGPVAQVALLSAGQSRAEVGIGILYASGVKFFATPGADSMGWSPKSAQANPALLPFKDGRSKPFDVTAINGRDTLIQKGGVQVSKVGGEVPVPPTVAFKTGDVHYELKTQDASVTVDTLIAIAKSIP